MPNDGRLSIESIEDALRTLPTDSLNSDLKIADAQRQLDEALESLEIAKVNASLNANADGKNAEARALQIKAALAQDSSVKAAQLEVIRAKARIQTEEANNKMLSRQFAGMCHIAELRAAQMILQAKGAMK